MRQMCYKKQFIWYIPNSKTAISLIEKRFRLKSLKSILQRILMIKEEHWYRLKLILSEQQDDEPTIITITIVNIDLIKRNGRRSERKITRTV